VLLPGGVTGLEPGTSTVPSETAVGGAYTHDQDHVDHVDHDDHHHPGKVTLTVPNAQISRLAGTLLDRTVGLTVDGASKDACTDTGFGATNPSP